MLLSNYNMKHYPSPFAIAKGCMLASTNLLVGQFVPVVTGRVPEPSIANHLTTLETCPTLKRLPIAVVMITMLNKVRVNATDTIDTPFFHGVTLVALIINQHTGGNPCVSVQIIKQPLSPCLCPSTTNSDTRAKTGARLSLGATLSHRLCLCLWSDRSATAGRRSCRAAVHTGIGGQQQSS